MNAIKKVMILCAISIASICSLSADTGSQAAFDLGPIQIKLTDADVRLNELFIWELDEKHSQIFGLIDGDIRIYKSDVALDAALSHGTQILTMGPSICGLLELVMNLNEMQSDVPEWVFDTSEKQVIAIGKKGCILEHGARIVGKNKFTKAEIFESMYKICDESYLINSVVAVELALIYSIMHSCNIDSVIYYPTGS